MSISFKEKKAFYRKVWFHIRTEINCVIACGLRKHETQNYNKLFYCFSSINCNCYKALKNQFCIKNVCIFIRKMPVKLIPLMNPFLTP